MTEIDKFTLFCVECRIKELIIKNKEYKEIAKENRDMTDFLIFENRTLVLTELLGNIRNLSTSSIEHYEKLKKVVE